MTGAAPRTIDLFAGGGGFTLGAEAAKLDVVAAVENSPGPVDTYRNAFPDHALVTDPAQRVDWAALGAELGDVDVLIGGPPCEPFTPASAHRRTKPLSRLYDDAVGGLVLHAIRAIRALKPRVFALENVVQLAEGPLEAELRDLFKRAGYRVEFNVLRAEAFGTPSIRTRLFISNVEMRPDEKPASTVREAIGDLEAVEPGPSSGIPNHACEAVPNTLRRRLDGLEAGHSLRRWKGATGKVYGTWTRLDYDRVSPTVKGSGRFIHPVLPRALSVREHARLMGFPDEHVFLGPLSSQYDQTGEAVPPPLARVVCETLRAACG